MSEQAKSFLKKLNEQVDEGQFDDVINIPFASREMLKFSLKARLDKKIETGSTPLLSENEIKDAVKDVREIAVFTAAIFLEMGILQSTEEGIKVSEGWEKKLLV